MKVKKILSIMLALVIACIGIACNSDVQKDSENTTGKDKQTEINVDESDNDTSGIVLKPTAFNPDAPDGDTSSMGYAALMDSLAIELLKYDGTQGGEYVVTIQSPYALSEDECYEFYDTLFLHTVRENPEFFWINLRNRFNSYDASTKTVTYKVRVFPEFQGEKFAIAQKAFNEVLDSVVSEIFRPDMTDLEKVLSAYCWIMQNVKYDQDTEWTSYSAYSGLVNRLAVCHGSAVTMNLLMREAGVDCCTVLSTTTYENVFHIWNAVKVDEKWYNIDATAPNVPGHFSYNYFLKSTSEMLEGSIRCEHITRMHVSCDNTYTGDKPWTNTTNAFLYSDEYKGCLNVENYRLSNGTYTLSENAKYRVVRFDGNGKATSKVISTIPDKVLCCNLSIDGKLYYMNDDGNILVCTLSSNKIVPVTNKNYDGYYMSLNKQNGQILILDSVGKTIDTISLN